MRRSSQIPTYRFHRGSGQAVVRVDGRDMYLGVHGSPESKERYREITKRQLADRTKVELERSDRFYVDVTVAEIVAKCHELPAVDPSGMRRRVPAP